MMVTVRLFARAKELVGFDAVAVEVSEPATISVLRRQLAVEYPRLEPLLAHSAFAVDNEFADGPCPLSPNAEIALLPPVSGG
jgi:molybdopterin converting factor small subunit